MIASNRTAKPLIVLGQRDEPFLRIADGVIESNAHSPFTYTTRSPNGSHTVAPANLDPEGRPDWREVGRGNSWSWFDPRLRPSSAGSDTWAIAAHWNDQRISITGSFEPFEGHGHFDTSIDAGPTAKGLAIEVHDGLVPALYVDNHTSEVLHVEGRSGEPFLRIGPKGVFGNLESPDYYIGGAQTIRPVPRGVDPDDPPRWRKLSEVPIWTWLEFRARLPASAGLRSTLGNERHAVLRWETPMALGRTPFAVEGTVYWNPPVGTAATGRTDPSGILRLVFYAIAAAGAIAVGFWALRERRLLPR